MSIPETALQRFAFEPIGENCRCWRASPSSLELFSKKAHGRHQFTSRKASGLGASADLKGVNQEDLLAAVRHRVHRPSWWPGYLRVFWGNASWPLWRQHLYPASFSSDHLHWYYRSGTIALVVSFLVLGMSCSTQCAQRALAKTSHNNGVTTVS